MKTATLLWLLAIAVFPVVVGVILTADPSVWVMGA